MTAESILLYQLERISIGSVYHDWLTDRTNLSRDRTSRFSSCKFIPIITFVANSRNIAVHNFDIIDRSMGVSRFY